MWKRQSCWGVNKFWHILSLRMYLLEEELVWAKRGLEQTVSALDNIIMWKRQSCWGEQILTHSFTLTVPGEKSEDKLVENIGHVSELLRQGHIYLPAGSKRSDHCCLIHMLQSDAGLKVKRKSSKSSGCTVQQTCSNLQVTYGAYSTAGTHLIDIGCCDAVIMTKLPSSHTI